MRYFLTILFLPILVMAGRLSNTDFATLSELQARGASATALLNDDKIYVKTNNINKQLSLAIQDGDIGGGGSGMSGLNLVPNPDFEKSLNNWLAVSATATRVGYTTPSAYNKFYAQVTTTQANGYYETDPLIIPNSLANGDLQTQALVMPVSGTWAIQSISGTVVVASQTLTVSPDWQKSPLIFNPAGNASGTMKVRFQAIASGSVLRIDNVYKGEVVNLKNGAVVESEQFQNGIVIGAVTTAPTKGASITTDRIVYRRVGSQLEAEYEYQQNTAGTNGSGDYLYSLPTGMSFDLNKVQLFTVTPFGGTANHTSKKAIVGDGQVGDNAAVGDCKLFAYSATQFRAVCEAKFAQIQVLSSAFYGLAASPAIGFKFRIKAPIAGQTGSNTTFDSRCPNDISCTNVFSAYINSGGTVQFENLDWINGSCTYTAGVATCNFNTGVFTAPPNCTANSVVSTNTATTMLSGTTTANSVQFLTRDSSNGAALNRDLNIICQKQGADFVAKRTIEGFLSKQVTSTGNFIERIERVTVSGAGGYGTNCAVSPCIISDNSGAVTSVTRISTGLYSINFAAGTFISRPVCLVSGVPTGTAGNCKAIQDINNNTATGFRISCDNGAAAADGYFTALCMGAR